MNTCRFHFENKKVLRRVIIGVGCLLSALVLLIVGFVLVALNEKKETASADTSYSYYLPCLKSLSASSSGNVAGIYGILNSFSAYCVTEPADIGSVSAYRTHEKKRYVEYCRTVDSVESYPWRIPMDMKLYSNTSATPFYLTYDSFSWSSERNVDSLSVCAFYNNSSADLTYTTPSSTSYTIESYSYRQVSYGNSASASVSTRKYSFDTGLYVYSFYFGTATTSAVIDYPYTSLQYEGYYSSSYTCSAGYMYLLCASPLDVYLNGCLQSTYPSAQSVTLTAGYYTAASRSNRWIITPGALSLTASFAFQSGSDSALFNHSYNSFVMTRSLYDQECSYFYRKYSDSDSGLDVAAFIYNDNTKSWSNNSLRYIYIPEDSIVSSSFYYFFITVFDYSATAPTFSVNWMYAFCEPVDQQGNSITPPSTIAYDSTVTSGVVSVFFKPTGYYNFVDGYMFKISGTCEGGGEVIESSSVDVANIFHVALYTPSSDIVVAIQPVIGYKSIAAGNYYGSSTIGDYYSTWCEYIFNKNISSASGGVLKYTLLDNVSFSGSSDVVDLFVQWTYTADFSTGEEHPSTTPYQNKKSYVSNLYTGTLNHVLDYNYNIVWSGTEYSYSWYYDWITSRRTVTVLSSVVVPIQDYNAFFALFGAKQVSVSTSLNNATSDVKSSLTVENLPYTFTVTANSGYKFDSAYSVYLTGYNYGSSELVSVNSDNVLSSDGYTITITLLSLSVNGSLIVNGSAFSEDTTSNSRISATFNFKNCSSSGFPSVLYYYSAPFTFQIQADLGYSFQYDTTSFSIIALDSNAQEIYINYSYQYSADYSLINVTVSSISSSIVSVEISASAQSYSYKITYIYSGVSGSNLPSAIYSTNTASDPVQASFSLLIGYTFSGYSVQVNGAQYSASLSSDGLTLTVSIYNASGAVSVTVNAVLNGGGSGGGASDTGGAAGAWTAFIEPCVIFLQTNFFGSYNLMDVLSIPLFIGLALLFLKFFAGG